MLTSAQSGSVAPLVVAFLLVGRALGPCVGAGATNLVDEDEVEDYFAAMLPGEPRSRVE